mgnify:CR=1 FL=1
MKKLSLILTALGVLLVGAGLSNTVAASFDYPVGQPPDIITDVPTVGTGGNFNATVTNCLPGETVTFIFEGVERTTTCDPNTLQASFPFVAPMTPGSYQVCAVLTGDGATVPPGVTRPSTVCTTIEVTASGPTVPPTVPGGGLPGTGSSGVDTNLALAGTALVVGLGLLIVAGIRRRDTAPATS